MLRLQSIFAFFVTIFFAANVFAVTAPTKTVLITGGATGLGRDIALEFQKDGWNVWATTRDPSKHTDLPGVNLRKVDLTNQQQVHALLNEIRSKDGRLDVLVNNAGYGIIGPQEAVSAAQAKELFNVNVIGPMIVTQEALPLLRAHSGSHIINVSSTSGIRAIPGLGLYAGSKMALEGMSEALAAELLPWNIKVSLIEPGTVNNDWVNHTQQAANLENYPGYKNFTSRLRTNLASKAKEIGQNPHEIALLTLSVAKTSNPHLRYQTGSQSISVANEVRNDPTGNTMREKMSMMAKDLYDLPG